MIILHIIAQIIIYIWLRFISLHHQNGDTYRFEARLSRREGGRDGWELRGGGAMGEGWVRRDEASCWVQGWRACKRSQ